MSNWVEIEPQWRGMLTCTAFVDDERCDKEATHTMKVNETAVASCGDHFYAVHLVLKVEPVGMKRGELPQAEIKIEVKDDVPEAGDSERRGQIGPHGEGGRSDVQRRDWGVECE
jgi:hypothetical protein